MSHTVRTWLAVLACVALAACGGADDGDPAAATDPSGTTPADDAVDLAPGIVTDIGGLGDNGFNDLAAQGLRDAEAELGISGRLIEPDTPASYESNLTQLAESGAQPVFGIGFTFADAMDVVAQQFPDTHFGIVDAVVEQPNAVSLVFREEEGSYLAGVVAGLMTGVDTEHTDPDTDVVGFIGGQESPLIEKFGAGFQQGVGSVCADCEVLFQYVGSTTEAFSDPGTASEIAHLMHSQGADVIYHAAGASGDGVFRAATEDGFFAIGVNVDQAVTNPDAPILTSVLKGVDAAIQATIAQEAAGQFEAGIQSFGLSNGGIDLAGFGDYADVVPDDVTAAVEEARAGIVDGSITVATTLAELG